MSRQTRRTDNAEQHCGRGLCTHSNTMRVQRERELSKGELEGGRNTEMGEWPTRSEELAANCKWVPSNEASLQQETLVKVRLT